MIVRSPDIAVLGLCLPLLLTVSLALGQSKSLPLTMGERITLSSQILGEEREIWISLPSGYDGGSSRFPVLYLLDGEWGFQHVTGIVEHLSKAGRIAPLIVVGIVNVDRLRDFTPIHSLINLNGESDSATFATTGGAERFVEFLRVELLPFVDEHYRTRPYRIVAGNSLGGLFVTYVLETTPDLFTGYINVSPAVYGGNMAVLRDFDGALRSFPSNPKRLYIALGHEPLLQPVFDALVRKLTQSAPHSLLWKAKQYEDEDHASVPHLATYDGLRFIYAHWWIDVLDTARIPSLESLKSHYRSLSEEFGFNIPVPEEMANSLGYRLLSAQRRVEEAIAVFEDNAGRYPDSFNVFDSLAEAYAVKGDKKRAIENYRKSVELNPRNEAGKRMLEQLSN